MIVGSDAGLSCVSSRDLTDHDGVASSSWISEDFNGAEYLRKHCAPLSREPVHLRDVLKNKQFIDA